jgi:competence protein ComEC
VPLFAGFLTLGTLAFQQLAAIPHPAWLAPILALLATLTVVGRGARQTWTRVAAAGLLAGFGVAHWHAWMAAPLVLPEAEGPRLEVQAVGTVIGLPADLGRRSRFVFRVDTLTLGGRAVESGGRSEWRFRITWYDAPRLAPGQTWSLPLRLKRARGYSAPGAWDYEGWLYHRGIRYTGYVHEPDAARRIGQSTCCVVDRLRARISGQLEAQPLSAFARAVLRALVVADRSGLSGPDRALFRDTGTSHLMAVSGLHIGLVSGGVFWLTGLLWRRLPWLCRRLPAPVAAAAGGLAAAVGYAALAGFGLPTQRALIMLAVFAVAAMLRRRPRPVNALATAAVLILVWHPPSVVDAGFWLSFGAVGAIFAALIWSADRPAWWRAIQVQGLISVALLPLLFLNGLPVSGISPLVNLLLIPVFGALIVPGALVGSLLLTVLPSLGGALLSLLGAGLDLIQSALEIASAQPLSLPQPPALSVVAIGVAVLLWLAPPGVPLRRLAWPLLLLPLMPRQPVVGDGDFAVHVLDVGQGLSVVVETHRHVLVYDTGPAYPGGFSTANAVLLPFLATRGHRHVDHLVISHGDNDHGGGVGDLREAVSVGRLSSGEPARVGRGAVPCVAGQRWQWDGVGFEVLHPDAGWDRQGNDASCVVRVRNAAGTLLLTGDIEAATERYLLAGRGEALASDVVVAAHHGSASSSTTEFVGQVAARHVVYTAGWANRYGFPNPAVRARWAAAGARAHETARDGSLTFSFGADGRLRGPEAYRRKAVRYWSADVGSVGPGHAVSSADQ